jgi:L-2-hydroxyglutarate oxidase
MTDLEIRCNKNGIETHRWTGTELSRSEPMVAGVGALFVPATGITDYGKITLKMVELFTRMGGCLKLGQSIRALEETHDSVKFTLEGRRFKTRYLIVCGGLMADRIAQRMGIDIDFRIVPFRGEYYQLSARHNRIVKHLIYPIPDPGLPFLGVHLTRMVDGSVTVGPNAVLGWKREGYGRFNLDARDTLEMLIFKGFWKVLKHNLKTGLGELKDSFHKHGYLKRVRKYCPSLTHKDLKPYPAGIRAQAVQKDGTLVHDFLFVETARSLHVCNAPSPAATSAIPIGAHLCEKIRAKFSI